MNIIKNMFLLSVCLMFCGCASDKRKIVDSYRHEQISQNRVLDAFGEPYNKIINKNMCYLKVAHIFLFICKIIIIF